MRSLRLVSTNPSPVVGPLTVPLPEPSHGPRAVPLISSEARKTEAEGKRFYPRVQLKPSDLPSTYLALTAYPRRTEHHGTLTGHLVTVVLAAAVAAAVYWWVRS